MNVSFSKSKQKQDSSQTSQTDPWDVTIPYITDFLGKVGTASAAPAGPNATQQTAYDQLETNAKAGNPYAGQIDNLAGDLFGSTNYSPEVASGYDDLERRLTPTANGANLDIAGNKQLQDALKVARDDAAFSVNSQFAGAGRDISGINTQALTRGVTQAEAPLLLNQYNTEQARTDAAARDLNSAKTNAATTKSSLDTATAGLREAGIDVGNQALAAKDYGPNQVINLEQQIKDMPFDQLSKIAALLYPAAGLGSQESGTATATTKGTTVGGKADVGTALGKLLTLLG